MKKIWLAFVMVMACGCHPEYIVHRSPPCVSTCGMLLEDVNNGAISCTYLNEAEETTLAAFDQKLCSEDERFCKKNACDALFGWQIYAPRETVATQNGSDFYVGLSRCRYKVMEIYANSDWRHGAYPHELAHAVFTCVPPQPTWEESAEDGKAIGHEGWFEHGVYGVLDQIERGMW